MYLPRRRPPLPGLPQGLNVHKVDGQPPQLDPRPQPRPASHVPVHLGESMPKAALDHGLRPHLRNRAMRTTRSLARYMPSTKTTLWTSSTHSGMGHILQNLPVRRLKPLPPPGIERMVSLPSRHPRKASRSALSVLYLTTDEPPHDVHLHLCLPALVNPFFLSLAPQTAIRDTTARGSTWQELCRSTASGCAPIARGPSRTWPRSLPTLLAMLAGRQCKAGSSQSSGRRD